MHRWIRTQIFLDSIHPERVEGEKSDREAKETKQTQFQVSRTTKATNRKNQFLSIISIVLRMKFRTRNYVRLLFIIRYAKAKENVMETQHYMFREAQNETFNRTPQTCKHRKKNSSNSSISLWFFCVCLFPRSYHHFLLFCAHCFFSYVIFLYVFKDPRLSFELCVNFAFHLTWWICPSCTVVFCGNFYSSALNLSQSSSIMLFSLFKNK